MIQNLKAKEILLKYDAGTCTDEEKEWVENWYLQLPAKSDQTISSDDLNKDLDLVWLGLPVHQQNTKHKLIPRKASLWPKYAAAAILLMALSIGGILMLKQQTTDRLITYKDDVPAGGNNAILTLADGRKISLNEAADGALVEKTGLSITKTAGGQLIYKVSGATALSGFNTINTPRGGQYQVVLPDGTKIWLNAATELKFPTSFANKELREVELRGEAYFEVAHLAKQPFIVKTAQQAVKVLGTHFNISSYPDDIDTKTTLLTGSVSVGSGSNLVMLKPGQQSVKTTSGFKVKNVDSEVAVAWKNGYFLFNDESLTNIMKEISRWYDVEVVFTGDIGNQHFDGSVSRFKNISEILRKFELTDNVHFKIEGRRITVMP